MMKKLWHIGVIPCVLAVLVLAGVVLSARIVDGEVFKPGLQTATVRQLDDNYVELDLRGYRLRHIDRIYMDGKRLDVDEKWEVEERVFRCLMEKSAFVGKTEAKITVTAVYPFKQFFTSDAVPLEYLTEVK